MGQGSGDHKKGCEQVGEAEAEEADLPLSLELLPQQVRGH